MNALGADDYLQMRAIWYPYFCKFYTSFSLYIHSQSYTSYVRACISRCSYVSILIGDVLHHTASLWDICFSGNSCIREAGCGSLGLGRWLHFFFFMRCSCLSKSWALVEYKDTILPVYCGDKTVVRSSYLHNGISYTCKNTYYTESTPWMFGSGTKFQI